jgi:hypothetical protein
MKKILIGILEDLRIKNILTKETSVKLISIFTNQKWVDHPISPIVDIPAI